MDYDYRDVIVQRFKVNKDISQILIFHDGISFSTSLRLARVRARSEIVSYDILLKQTTKTRNTINPY